MDRDELYADFHKEMNAIEEQREQIAKKMRNIDADQSIFEDILGGMNRLFRELVQHCDEDHFIRALEDCEDEFDSCQRFVENDLEEQRDMLETERRRTYQKEDELLENLNRNKLLLDQE